MYFYKGFNENVCTFKASGDIPNGYPVVLCDNHTVTAAGDGVAFHGVAVAGRNGAVSVQLTGYVELPYSGSTPGVGTNSLVADGNGGVKISTGGSQHLVVCVDENAGTVGVII